MDGEHSRDRFTEALSHHRAALIALSGDVLYHAMTEVLCRSLDVIDTVTDRETAFRIADALAARWAADAEAHPMRRVTVPHPIEDAGTIARARRAIAAQHHGQPG